MPNYDGTGPYGEGARTGRGAGYCPPSKRNLSGTTGKGMMGTLLALAGGFFLFKFLKKK